MLCHDHGCDGRSTGITDHGAAADAGSVAADADAKPVWKSDISVTTHERAGRSANAKNG